MPMCKQELLFQFVRSASLSLSLLAMHMQWVSIWNWFLVVGQHLTHDWKHQLIPSSLLLGHTWQEL